MEIHRMLALSTAHLSQATLEKGTDAFQLVTAFEKGEYGWFVYVPEQQLLEELVEGLTEDVANCIRYAAAQDMQWIMFDRDVDVIDQLASH